MQAETLAFAFACGALRDQGKLVWLENFSSLHNSTILTTLDHRYVYF